MSKLSLSEVDIVAAFASACPYGIIITSIEKREPPEPDIRCQISDGSWVAFEVTESIDEEIAKRNNDSIFMKRKLEEYVESSPNKYDFQRKYHNAIIFICPINRRLDKRYFTNNIDMLIEYLLNNIQGKHEFIFPDNKFMGIITRGTSIGPIYDTNFGSDFNDYIINRIENKFKKIYRTDLRIELLIQYHEQPITFAWDVQDGINFIKRNIKNSPFNRAWIYSTKENKILAVYPES